MTLAARIDDVRRRHTKQGRAGVIEKLEGVAHQAQTPNARDVHRVRQLFAGRTLREDDEVLGALRVHAMHHVGTVERAPVERDALHNLDRCIFT